VPVEQRLDHVAHHRLDHLWFVLSSLAGKSIFTPEQMQRPSVRGLTGCRNAKGRIESAGLSMAA
jgi:hypothetical protein